MTDSENDSGAAASVSATAAGGWAQGKSAKVQAIGLTVLVGTWLATAYHYVLGVYYRITYPANTYLFRPEDRFHDLYNSMEYARRLLSGNSDVVPYSPLATSLMAVFGHLSNAWARTLALGVFAAFVAMFVWTQFAGGLGWRKTHRATLTFIVAAMSYPVLFVADRANEEMFVFMAIVAFVYFYLVRKSPWSGVFLGIAIAYKIFPAVLLVLILADRRWKDLAVAAATVVGSTLITALGLGIVSGLGLVGVLKGWYKTLFVGHVGYSSTLEAAQHGHSLWGLVVSSVGLLQGGDPVGLSTSAYAVFALVTFLGLVLYVCFVERTPWKRVALLIIAMVLLPYESHDYTLVHLLVPMALFVNAPRTKWDAIYALLFGLVMVPLDYAPVIAEVSTAAFAYPLLLVLMASLIIASRQRGAMSQMVGHA